MIKEIKVYSRQVMDAYVKSKGSKFPYDSWYLISIYSDDGPLVDEKTSTILSRFRCKDKLSLHFWDVTDKQYEDIKKSYPKSDHCKKMKLFNKDQAKKIIDFIDIAQKDPKATALVVHCSAGISRSGAVATFACDYCRLDYGEFIRINPLLYPNPFVLRTLREISGMTPVGSHNGISSIII